MNKILKSSILLFVAFNTQAQTGILDNTFNGTGIVTTQFRTTGGNLFNDPHGVAIQTDGKIVVGGEAISTNGTFDFAVARYKLDGSLDTSFGTGGKVLTPITTGQGDFVRAICIQSDGKILLSGITETSGGTRFAIVRYNSNGTLDVTFGTGGKVVTTIMGFADEIQDMEIQTDGKIIVGGNTFNSDFSISKFVIARYNSNGTLDNTFNGTGYTILDFGATMYNELQSIKIQTDGKILAGGYSYDTLVLNADFSLLRLEPNGNLDVTFGTAGKLTLDINTGWNIISDINLQTDGKIIATGSTNTGTNLQVTLCKFLSNGTLDNTFGTSGIRTDNYGPSNASFGNNSLIQPDGKIISVGPAYITSTTSIYGVIRHNNDGTLDNTFGTNGKVLTNIGTGESFPFKCVLQNDGKLIVIGWEDNVTDRKFAILRYTTGLTLGIIDFKTIDSIILYPNPVSSISNIEYNLEKTENIDINLYDSNGKLVQNIIKNNLQFAGKQSIPCNINMELQNGVYLIAISNGKSNTTIKMIIQK